MSGYEQVPVAEMFFWLAHDDRGVPGLRPRILGLTLAAGLLGDLVLIGKIVLRDDRVVCRDRASAHGLDTRTPSIGNDDDCGVSLCGA